MTTGVVVDFNANLTRFTSGVDKAINDLNKFQSNAARISGNISKAFGALGIGIGVGAFTALIKGSIDAQDHLLDLSKTTRLSVEQLSGLSFAAKNSGSDLDGTAKAINKLAVEMGKDADKFKALGITAKSPLEAFGQLADVMNAIEDPQTRAAVGAAALGKSWETAAPLMAEGGKVIHEMIEEGRRLSGATTEGAKAADEFNTKWEAIKTRGGGWFTTVVANPIVSGMLAIADSMHTLEIAGGPGSVFSLIFGKGPQKKSLGATGSWDAPAPSNESVKGFIGGKSGAAGKTPLQTMLDAQKKRIAELNALAGDEQMVSVDSVSSQYDTKATAENLQRLNDLLAATPTGQLQKAREEMQFLAAALEKGTITEVQFAEAVGEHYGKASEALEQMNEFAIEAARGIQDAFADFLFDPFSDKTDSMLEKFGTMLRKMAAQAAAAQLSEALFGDMGKTGKVGGLAGGLGDFFKDLLPKYAQGTPWVPNDGLAYLHKGEQVIPAGKSGGGGVSIVVNNTAAPDVTATASARNNNGAMEIEVLVHRAIAKDMARNGPITQGFGSMFNLPRAV